MNKTAIRNFAVWARNKLIADVSYHAGLMGITKNGISQALSQSTKDVEFFDIGTAEPYAVRGEAIQQRKSLVEAIRQKEKDSNYETAYSSLMEEVAYTWFNRLIAVRFMEVNDYLPAHVRVLSAESGKQEPDIVTNPFDAELFFAEGEDQKIIQMKNDNELDEVFRILFVKQCRELSMILPRLFEGTNDYTELLLSVSFIDQEGVVYHLVHDIPEEDFNVEKGGQVEIIGWLYQYYNDEKKNDVINIQKSAISKEDIPAATQLFTTDWVVRYIVDNSLGKYWIERHPDSRLKDSLEYLIVPKSGKLDIVYDEMSPEQIKILDPCMGSGHFLVYAFDVLMSIYEESGYTQRDAAKSIIENNLYGLDIDDRAAQMAYFAVMMKARQYNRRIIDGQTKCNVMAVVESNGFDTNCLTKMGDLRKTAEKLLEDFKDAKEYGTIIQPSINESELDALVERLQLLDEASDYGNLLDMLYTDQLLSGLMPLVEQARIMINKYHVVDTNPPYLNKYPLRLKNFINDNYADFKGDLFSVFIYRNALYLAESGYAGFMTPMVWMFIQNYEKLRSFIVNEKEITDLIQFEYSAFEEATVPICSFVIKNELPKREGVYFRLTEFKGGMNVQRDKVIQGKEDTECDYVYETDQKEFLKLPGFPIAYWVSSNLVAAFENGKKLIELARTRQGLASSDNNRFLKIWWEPNHEKLGFKMDAKAALESRKKWFPCNKGGEYRKWYGNNSYVVNWENDGEEMLAYAASLYGSPTRTIKNIKYYFMEGMTWGTITSGNISMRHSDKGFIPEHAGGMIPVVNWGGKEKYLLALMNTCVAMDFLAFLSPTLRFTEGPVGQVPVLLVNDTNQIEKIVDECEELSRRDWDSFEISWDFKKHPLI